MWRLEYETLHKFTTLLFHSELPVCAILPDLFLVSVSSLTFVKKKIEKAVKLGPKAMALQSLSAPRRRLARIRCLQECISCLSKGKPLPECICYVPLELEYRCPSKTSIKLYASADTSKEVVKEVACTAESRFIVSGEELCNAQGKWLKVRKVRNLTQWQEILLNSHVPELPVHIYLVNETWLDMSDIVQIVLGFIKMIFFFTVFLKLNGCVVCVCFCSADQPFVPNIEWLQKRSWLIVVLQ